MDDNVKNTDKPRRNNRSRSYNKNYYKKSKPETDEISEDVSEERPARSSGGSENRKPRNNKNYNGSKKRASDSSYSENRNPKGSKSGTSKPKGYYMSKPTSEEDFDELFGDVFSSDDVVEFESEKQSDRPRKKKKRPVQNVEEVTEISEIDFSNFEDEESVEVRETRSDRPKKKKKRPVQNVEEVTEISEVDFSNFEDEESVEVREIRSDRPKKKKKRPVQNVEEVTEISEVDFSNFADEESVEVRETRSDRPKKKKKRPVQNIEEVTEISEVDFSNFEDEESVEVRETRSDRPKKKKKRPVQNVEEVTEISEVDFSNFADEESVEVRETRSDRPKKKKKRPVQNVEEVTEISEVELSDFEVIEEAPKKVNDVQSDRPKKKKKPQTTSADSTEKTLKKKSAGKKAAAIAAASAVTAAEAEKRSSKSTRSETSAAEEESAAAEKRAERRAAAAERRRNRTNKEDPNSEENRKKSETRFWGRMFSLAAIVPVYTAIVICMLAMPRSTVSNIEKRNLDTFPKFSWSDYWSGTYTAGITHYFDDTVPFRDNLKQAGSQLLNLLGIKYNDVQITGQMQVVNDKTANTDNTGNSGNSDSGKSSSGGKANTAAQNEDTDSEEEEITPKGQEIADGVYANGIIVVYQDGHYRGMSMYGGGTGDVYVDSLNKFAADLPGVKLYSMVDPTSSEFYTPLNFSDYNASQSDDIESINSRLQNVKGINPCPTLAKHVNETIYTRTDHHWMSLGAYYAAQDFAKAAGVPFLDIKDYQKKTNPGYVGTMYSFSGNNPNLLNDPEDFIYYVPKNKNYSVKYYDYGYNFVTDGDLFADVTSNGDMYCTFIYGDIYTVKISTGVKNGRKLCLVKDSYGDAIPPFLTGSFEEIYVVDMRYFELNLVDFVKEQGVTDLLFSCCSYSAVGTNADNLENLRTMGGSAPADDEDEDEDIDDTSSTETTDSKLEDDDDFGDTSADDTDYSDNSNDDDDIFNNINVDDGQLGFVGNINDDNTGGDDDFTADYDDYDYDEDY